MAPRNRHDIVFLSTVLFTITMLYLAPICLRAALASHDKAAFESLDAGYQAAAQATTYLGISGLAVICIAMTVVWTGFRDRHRWAWLVMAFTVWAWAFPIFVLPIFGHPPVTGWRDIASEALREAGPPRHWAETVVVFGLMVFALILPIKSFFVNSTSGKPGTSWKT